MNNGIKGKESENKFFTIEFFGVSLIITSLLLLLCLFFGKDILFEIGMEIQFFILGVFGYFSYPLLFSLLVVGVMVLLGKKPNLQNKKGSLAMFIYLLFIAFTILTITSNSPNPTTLQEYVKLAFDSGRNGPSAVVAGGAMFAIPAFYCAKYLGDIFSIVVLCLLTIIVIYARIKYKRKHKNYIDNSQQQPQQQVVPNNQVPPQYNTYNPNPYNNGFQSNVYNQGVGGGYQQPVQPNPYAQPNQMDSNVYGTPVNGGGASIFGGQVYQNGQVKSNEYYSQAQPSISKEDAMRILYGNAPKTYSADFNDSFSSGNFRRTDEFDKPFQTNQNNGQVSSEIPKNIQFDDYTYEDRTFTENQEFNLEEEDSNYQQEFNFEEEVDSYNQDASFDDASEEESNESAKSFFGKIKEKYDSQKTESNRSLDFVEDSLVKESLTEQENTENNTQYGKKLIENMPKNYKYNRPPLSLLKTLDNTASDYEFEVFKAEMKARILTTLKVFGVETEVARVFRGPAVTRFDIAIPHNVPMSKVTKLQNDLNLRIAASSEIRMIAPVPNTSYVGIEIPNQVQEMVSIKDIISSEGFVNSKPFSLTFALGKDVIGKPVSLDLADMPHLLVTGTTGSGKSVCLNTMIISLISKYGPDELRIVIVDPKRVDLEPFKEIPHMMFGEIIEDVPTTNAMLTWAVEEMENRYKLLAKYRAKNIKDYNSRAKQNGERIIPRIVIIIDEFADIMLQDKKGVGNKVCAIAQKARAAGMHLVLAAQRPSVDIIEGPIKSNLPSRIVFKASSIHDSITSLGEVGAEKLLGHGDCLYKTNGMFAVERVMGAYVSDDEMYAVIDYVSDNNEKYFDYNNWAKIQAAVSANNNYGGESDGESSSSSVSGDPSSDALKIKAMRIGYEFGGLSTSFLQRKLGVGYPRAAKIIDWLTDNGYLSPIAVSGKRQMVLSKEEFEEKFGTNDNE